MFMHIFAYLTTDIAIFIAVRAQIEQAEIVLAARRAHFSLVFAVMSGLAGLKMDQKYARLSREKRWEVVEPEVDAILQKSRAKNAIPIMLRDEAFKVLATIGLAETKQVAWMDTGFHPMNRSKSGIILAKVQDKVMHLHAKGISLLECSKAVSIARVPGKLGDEHESANMDVVQRSDGFLASVKHGSLN